MSDDFTHRVLPYDGVEEFLGGAVPFLRDGVDAGDRVLAVCGAAQEMLLRDALGPDAGAVLFRDAATWYRHPFRTLADWLGDADESSRQGRRLRLLGEPAWAWRSPLEVVEWERAEALLNVAVRGTGAAVLCPYAASLPAGVVAAARKTHPETVRGTRALRNPGFVDPWTFCARCDADPLPPPPAGAETLPLDARPDLFWLRAWVTECARPTPLPDEGLQRLLVAVTEVVTNALRHGAPPVVLRIWTDAADREPALLCEVADAGRWPPGSGYGLLPPRPSDDASGGRFGLWAVRLLCSTVQIRTGGAGTVVRLRLTLPRPRPAAVDGG